MDGQVGGWEDSWIDGWMDAWMTPLHQQDTQKGIKASIIQSGDHRLQDGSPLKVNAVQIETDGQEINVPCFGWGMNTLSNASSPCDVGMQHHTWSAPGSRPSLRICAARFEPDSVRHIAGMT
eukprot:scaffold448478_cov27-Prasinocladus_malaysianus.AAC.1